MNKLVAKQRFGFTIVELLIVIVVIAILAAIAIVAYNGIQQRVETQKVEATVMNYLKTFELHRAAHGSYPVTSYSYGAICVGREEDYPAADGFEAGQCFKNLNFPLVRGHADNELHDRLSDITTGLSDNTSLRVWTPSWGNLSVRGVFLTYLNHNYIQIVYALPGDQPCIAQGSNISYEEFREQYLSSQNLTQCVIEVWV